MEMVRKLEMRQDMLAIAQRNYITLSVLFSGSPREIFSFFPRVSWQSVEVLFKYLFPAFLGSLLRSYLNIKVQGIEEFFRPFIGFPNCFFISI
jgi:hypothetical protein